MTCPRPFGTVRAPVRERYRKPAGTSRGVPREGGTPHLPHDGRQDRPPRWLPCGPDRSLGICLRETAEAAEIEPEYT